MLDQPQSGSSFSSRDLRDALSSFATGVTIVTTVDATGDPVGMTASSFNSVSMDPPLILWSVTKTAHSAMAFKEASHFAVHVLASDQMNLSNRFAKSGADKFADLSFDENMHGVPKLDGALARFDCAMWAAYEGGDHWIIVGRVEDMHARKGEGLVFSGGSYATASSIQAPPAQSGSDEEPVENLLIYNLARAHTQMATQFHSAVEEAGLTVPEWRILASLFGGHTRAFPDLVLRTFVSPKKLHRLLIQMADAGLLLVSGQDGDMRIQATEKGNSSVEHLFELGSRQERSALEGSGDRALEQLLGLLKQIIEKT